MIVTVHSPYDETFRRLVTATAQRAGITMLDPSPASRARGDVISVVWNGLNHKSVGPSLYAEHGWLPVWHYQISSQGINAESHIAPFRWDGRALPDAAREEVAQYLEAQRHDSKGNREHICTAADAVTDVPEAFLLVPLQIEDDTNIVRHAPKNLRSMQALIDFISAANPPLPVLYKQHPFDARWKLRNPHLKLQLRRSQDRLRPHKHGNIHQILKTERCSGIVALNSNVVHDGLLWDVPAVVLGRNIWPRQAPSPFLLDLPDDWSQLETWSRRQKTKLCREAYVHFLMRHQWSPEDLSDVDKFVRLLETVHSRPTPRRPVVRIASRRRAPRRRRLVRRS